MLSETDISVGICTIDLQLSTSGSTAERTARRYSYLGGSLPKKIRRSRGKTHSRISTDALQVLTQHDFPGNVRELENAIETAVLFETTDQLQQQNLPLYLTQEGSQTATGSPTDTTVILPLDEVERRAVVHALKVMDNNIPDAARALGIGRSTLYRKVKQYNLLL